MVSFKKSFTEGDKGFSASREEDELSVQQSLTLSASYKMDRVEASLFGLACSLETLSLFSSTVHLQLDPG